MKRKSVAIILSVVTVLSLGLSLVACNKMKADPLGKPNDVVALTYREKQSGEFAVFKDKADKFASKLAASAYSEYEGEDNFVLSPISAFMALSLAAECASGDTRAELLSALGVSYGELKTNFPLFYRSLYNSGETNRLIPTNSIWLDKSASVKQECIDALADKYYSYAYSADFKNDNSNANGAIRQFVKDKTNGLIDNDFKLSQQTLFAIINTLYLTTVWNTRGNDLSFSSQEYAFTANDGSIIQKKLLVGNYHAGRVCDAGDYLAFYTSTNGGYKIKFMLPKQGYGVDDVFTEEGIATLNAINFSASASENGIYYETRCIFPEYKCAYDGDLKNVLKDEFGVNKFFIDPITNPDGCTLSSITDTPCFCEHIKHVVSLDVNKKGIEGAATVISDTVASAQPADVKFDFVIDRAFGFIITDSQDVALFSGVVESI